MIHIKQYLQRYRQNIDQKKRSNKKYRPKKYKREIILLRQWGQNSGHTVWADSNLWNHNLQEMESFELLEQIQRGNQYQIRSKQQKQYVYSKIVKFRFFEQNQTYLFSMFIYLSRLTNLLNSLNLIILCFRDFVVPVSFKVLNVSNIANYEEYNSESGKRAIL